MSRRAMTRNMNGTAANIWRGSGAEASVMGVTVATFGATGNIGHHVHAQCCYHNYTNIVPFRFRAGCVGSGRIIRHLNDGTCGQNFETDYEIDKEFVVKSILEKADNVINCVGAWQEPAMYEHSQSWFSMEAVNVEWPRMLARWCKEMGVLRLVHISMVGADLHSPSKLLRQKAEAELAVLEEFPTATIIRPTEVFWEDDSTFSRFLKAQRYWKVTPVVNHGHRIIQPVFAGDIGEAVARSILLDHTEGRIAELGGPIRFTTADLLRWCAECNNLYHFVAHVPKWAWKIMCAFHERNPLHRGAAIGVRAPLWNQDWLDRQFLDCCATPERNPELLDWEDFGIPREDLYRLEEKYFITSAMWAKEKPFLDYGRNL